MRRETICALCTPLGKGALSVIRLSGPKALKSLRALAPFLPPQMTSHKVYVGTLKNNKELLDQVVVTYFKEGESFTGEETLEISCHGGDFIAHKILNALSFQGVRFAQRGEFSLQSFLNGKVDLTQAESILHLIESKNSKTHQLALQQLRGALFKQIKKIEKQWLFILSHIEADIDFSLEDIQVLEDEDFIKNLSSLKQEVEALLCRYKPFDDLQEGLIVALFGAVNVGKSTLFNCLLKEDKAIVTDEAGTTRDPVDGKLVSPEGISLSLKDTAGFRETLSSAEQKGQKKTEDLLALCSVTVFVFEWGDKAFDEMKKLSVKDLEKTFVVFTKKDLHPKTKKEDVLIKFKKQAPLSFKKISKENIFFVSAVTGDKINELRDRLFRLGEGDLREDFFVTNQRHFNGLKKMKDSLAEAIDILAKQGGEKDLVSLNLREGLRALYEIIGKEFNEQILDEVFKQFCIGK